MHCQAAALKTTRLTCHEDATGCSAASKSGGAPQGSVVLDGATVAVLAQKAPRETFGASRSGPGNMDFLASRLVRVSPVSLHILGPLVEENPLVDAPLSIGGGSRSFNLQYFQNLLPARPTQDEFARHVEDL